MPLRRTRLDQAAFSYLGEEDKDPALRFLGTMHEAIFTEASVRVFRR